ncbi:MAG: DegT/DnrJ/EryC1/StrS family aminotransferase [Micromonosporaceae bacterium]
MPFRDLARLHAIERDESRAAIDAAIDSHDFGRPNALIAAFESAYADFCGVRHVIATSSGSAALLLDYLAHGIGPGDEILTVPNTFVATAEAALMLGATVRLVDVDPRTHAIDQAQAVSMLSGNTRAVVPLHPYGRLAQLDALRQATRDRGIALIEEACHAHGATRGGTVAGALGDSAVFSFGPTKPLAGLGEGGAVTTDDDNLAERLRHWNNHGRDGGSHVTMGLNFRIHPLEAAYLTARLRVLPRLLERRRVVAAAYTAAFEPYGVVHNPKVPDPAEHSYYVYVIDVPRREEFCRLLTQAGVGWDVHYPVAIHRQPAHAARFSASQLPCCDTLQERIVSLPMIDGLHDEEVEHVVKAVVDALDRVLS